MKDEWVLGDALCLEETIERHSAVADAFLKHGVVPDVIDVAPPNLAKVVFSDGVEVGLGVTQQANLGNMLTPTQTKDPPEVSWEGEKGELYTLLEVDPDAPSRRQPKLREWHQWLVVNIPGNSLKDGQTLSEYVGCGPPLKTGPHRYVYLVYKQPDGLALSSREIRYLSNKSNEGRSRWSTRDFVKKHMLGDPIAGNFFQAEFDDYVPLLYEQLKSFKRRGSQSKRGMPVKKL